jgi:guanylate kinase
MNKIVIISAPSGSGKSTLIGKLMKIKELKLEFSVSATTRAPRGKEVDGKDYYFLSVSDFQQRINADQFVEYEQVYEGRYYGTLRSELDRIFAKGHNIIFDVDVEGGINLKKIFGDDSISVFIQPPSVEELRRRLVGRGTDSAEEIEKRVSKAAQEIERAPMFDKIVINDDLDTAFKEFSEIVGGFLK